MELDPDPHVTVCCGSTETMLATLLAVLNPGDEVIIFEPLYENDGPGGISCRKPPSPRSACPRRTTPRDLLLAKVREAGFLAYEPKDAYYILTDVTHFLDRCGCRDDREFAMFLVER
jgi:aspartate/methionine/tyrosine aminotransferase